MKTKNFITGLTLTLTLFASCKKENIEEKKYSCECGNIIEEGISYESEYFMKIKNYCTGEIKKIILEPDTWINAKVGEMRCYSSQW